MSHRLTREEWDQMKIAYAGGAGLRELARNAGIPEGTVLARAKREGWTQQIAVAKLKQQPRLARELAKPNAIGAITPLQSTAITMQQRAERYQDRMGSVSERVLPLLEEMEPEKLLGNARDIELYDRVSRRNYGLENQPQQNGPIQIRNLITQSQVAFVIPKVEKPIT